MIRERGSGRGGHRSWTDRTGRDPRNGCGSFRSTPSPGSGQGSGSGTTSFALEIQILSAPERSVVVPGGKGLRKLRFAVPESGRGKSGSYRVFFATFPDRGIVLLMAVLAKGDKADLTKGDIKALAAILAQLGTLFDEGMIR